jgi:hypothetical protein
MIKIKLLLQNYKENQTNNISINPKHYKFKISLNVKNITQQQVLIIIIINNIYYKTSYPVVQLQLAIVSGY